MDLNVNSIEYISVKHIEFKPNKQINQSKSEKKRNTLCIEIRIKFQMTRLRKKSKKAHAD